MAIEMIAAKRFRMATDKGFVWLDKGQTYTVATEKEAKFHERGRGTRAKASEKEASK